MNALLHNRWKLALATLLGCVVLAGTAWPAEQTDPLAGLRPTHPRLLASPADWQRLAAARKTNAELESILETIETQARHDLSEKPVVYKKEGRRLLAVSRETLRRVLLWSSAFRLTGDRAFAARAEQEMLTVTEFPDWNPSHFLDTAEMTAALAFGYDWLYAELPPASRTRIRTAIIEKGLQPGLRPNGWQKTENNWNQVCFGGLTLGALAIGETDPQVAGRLLALARTGNLHGLHPYAPDGIYPEGPGYWEYGTSYEVLMLSALQSALGTDWQLTDSPGFLSSAAAQLLLTGPTGRPFNFSDCGDRGGFQAATFWFAQKLQRPDLLLFQKQFLAQQLARPAGKPDSLLPLVALWWRPSAQGPGTPNLPLNWHGSGPNPVGVFRSSWSDPNAVYLAFKGGSPRNNHAHMDAGSFVLDADGVRWGCDLGAQDYYSLESKQVDLWNSRQEGGRWTVFRLNNFSHSTLTLGGQLHQVVGQAKITEFHDAPEPDATVDLSELFAGQAQRVLRHFELATNRTVTISDQLTGLAPGNSVRWAMLTKAKVEFNGPTASLRQEGKQLQARILSPAGAQFSVIPAEPPHDGYNAPNPGASLLLINLAAPADGKMSIKVTFKPTGS